MNPKATTTLMLTLAALFLGSAKAETGRSLLVVLDASGSMNAKLPDGAARIDAAKAAVADLISGLPADTRLALRIYGHQSPTSKKDCQDTALVVSFGPAGENGGAVTVAANAAQAQGYTPITYVLQRAAADVGNEAAAASRLIVLVSDGKETCDGDPCAAAGALAAADTKLVVHTIGFGADEATRRQLQCIAHHARAAIGTPATAASCKPAWWRRRGKRPRAPNPPSGRRRPATWRSRIPIRTATR